MYLLLFLLLLLQAYISSSELQRLSMCSLELACKLIPYKDNGLFLRLQIVGYLKADDDLHVHGQSEVIC